MSSGHTCVSQDAELLLLTHSIELAAVHEPVAQLLGGCNVCQPPGSFRWTYDLPR